MWTGSGISCSGPASLSLWCIDEPNCNANKQAKVCLDVESDAKSSKPAGKVHLHLIVQMNHVINLDIFKSGFGIYHTIDTMI